MSIRSYKLATVGLIAVLGTGIAVDALADNIPWCARTDGTLSGPSPQNIVLILTDDTSLAAYPAFAPPILWPSETTPPIANPQSDPLKSLLLHESRRVRLDGNRLAARLLASPNGDIGTSIDPGAPVGSPERKVIPVDYNDAGNGSASAFYLVGSATTKQGVVKGFGGLQRMAKEGVVFSRFYATSGVCEPTRASIMSGRSPKTTGVGDNGATFRDNELIWPGFLKEIEKENGGAYRYKTLFLGKWHLGNSTKLQKPNAPWARGFDQALYTTASSRDSFDPHPLECGPNAATGAHTLSVDPTQGIESFYCTSPAIATQINCTYDTDCSNAIAACQNDKCDCGFSSVSATSGFCYLRNPENALTPPRTCNPNRNHVSGSDNTRISVRSCEGAGAGSECVRWGPYFGSHPGQSFCHPDDSANPLCCGPGKGAATSGVHDAGYSFGEKRAPGQNHHLFPPYGDDPQAATSCDASGSPFDSPTPSAANGFGCLFDVRVERDLAKNFIARYGHGQTADNPDTGTRFAIYVAPHATHIKKKAPYPTQAHYENLSEVDGAKANMPDDASGFFGALEELDATVGQILEQIAGFCDSADANPTAVGGFGNTCSSNLDCIAPTFCNQDLAKNTLVMYTSDQGSDGGLNGGESWLRGGKYNVYEGGIRVGLHAWGPGLKIGQATTNPAAPAIHTVADEIGSQVDLFATIAHAAGCLPNSSDHTHYQVHICDDDSRAPCLDGNNQACKVTGTHHPGHPELDSHADCVLRTMEGRTLLPSLSPSIAKAFQDHCGTSDSRRRNLAYATFAGTATVVSRPGYFHDSSWVWPQSSFQATQVCGYSASVSPELAGGDVPEDHIGRTLHGGSCLICGDPGVVDSPTDPPNPLNHSCSGSTDICGADGKFCLRTSTTVKPELGEGCRDLLRSTTCDAPHLRRCDSDSDCYKISPDPDSKSEACMPINVKCTGCMNASWKLLADDNTAAPKALYDVANNPEEQDTTQAGNAPLETQGVPMNCFTGGGQQNPAMSDVESHLQSKLDAWLECAHGGVVGPCEQAPGP